MSELPNRIRELRMAKELSQDQLAAAARASKTQISDLERGRRSLDVDWMRRIAAALGVTPGELLSRDDNPLIPEGDAERDLMHRYRSGTPDQQENLTRVADALIPYTGEDDREAGEGGRRSGGKQAA